MSAAEILREAKQLLVDRGWCQGNLQDCHGRRCMLGALRAAGFAMPWYRVAEDMLIRAIGDTGAHWSPVAVWNDAKGRTLDEVLNKFDQAIDIAEREHP